jgi:transcriptional regulator with XRE-family HTH domain
LRLSNTPDAVLKLIAALRKMRGMTKAELGEAIGYSTPVIGNIKQGNRKLGLKTLNNLFTALGVELNIEYRQK